MPRGGARPGSGPKKGAKYRKRLERLQLSREDVPAEGRATPAEKMRTLRRQVILMVADQHTPEKIAAVMGFDVEKLKTVFAHELQHGREIIRAEILMRFDEAGGGGSIAANKSLESITAALPIEVSRAQKSGKKESANAAAERAAAAGGIFAPRHPPHAGKSDEPGWNAITSPLTSETKQ